LSSTRRWIVCLGGAIACFCASAESSAQSVTGSLSGSIVDESAALIPGADVSLTNDASQDVRRTVTNADGFFTFAAVPPGTYTVRATFTGFKIWEITGVEIRVGDSRSLRPITLAVGGRTEVITVALRLDLVPLNSGEKSTTLTSDQIENVPIIGRSTTELLKILPGLIPATVGAQNRPAFSRRSHRDRWPRRGPERRRQQPECDRQLLG
jgi:hypothetical protein